MSSTLCFRPVTRDAETLPDGLKRALSKKLDGTSKIIFSANNYEYINGLIDAGVDGADQLLNEIGIHGEVELWLEY